MAIKNMNLKTINIDRKKSLIKYIETNVTSNNYYNNIFLILKLNYLQLCEKEKSIKVPQNLIKIFENDPKKLTFLHISGCNEINNCKIDDFQNNMIFIPQKIISNYFNSMETYCIDEKKFIKNKLDLYLSLLTYIYFHNFSNLNKNFNIEICNYIKNNTDNYNSDNDIITYLYNSNIYNFSKIPNDILNFEYNFKDNHIDLLNYYNQYVDENNLMNIEEFHFIFHHLITIFKFYNQYILSYFITSKSLYKFHPLIENNICQNFDNANK